MVLDDGEIVDLRFVVAATLVDQLPLRLQIILFLVILMKWDHLPNGSRLLFTDFLFVDDNAGFLCCLTRPEPPCRGKVVCTCFILVLTLYFFCLILLSPYRQRISSVGLYTCIALPVRTHTKSFCHETKGLRRIWIYEWKALNKVHPMVQSKTFYLLFLKSYY